jgi:aspartyl-tRNA(Asn)/glutamyl-tRNA(Gln) amidotransferase subunit C
VALENVLRPDEPRPSLSRDAALAEAPDSDGAGFRVPSPGA